MVVIFLILSVVAVAAGSSKIISSLSMMQLLIFKIFSKDMMLGSAFPVFQPCHTSAWLVKIIDRDCFISRKRDVIKPCKSSLFFARII